MFSPARAITAGAIVFAIGGVLLVAQPIQQQGTVLGAEADTGGSAPATVRGTLTDIREENGLFGYIADEVARHESETKARLEMDDSRLSGDWSGTMGINRYRFDPEEWESAAETYTGTVTVENEGGAWVGSVGGCGCREVDTISVQLVGTGGYDGLTAFLFSTEVLYRGAGDESPDRIFYGVVVPGDLVPDVPADSLGPDPDSES